MADCAVLPKREKPIPAPGDASLPVFSRFLQLSGGLWYNAKISRIFMLSLQFRGIMFLLKEGLAMQMYEKNTPLLYKLIVWLVWLFSPKYKIVGAEKLPKEPCVIVGNHSQMYGPIAGELYTPGKHHVWCAGEMMNRDEVADYAFQDFWSKKPKWTHWFWRLMSHLITPLAVLIFNNAHTVAVYHDTRLISTYRDSIEKLKAGSSMVIFPEHYDEHNNIVHDFQDKFIDLARFYYKKTGVELDFVPLYVAPELKTLFYGEPIRFHADRPIAAERRRICSELMDAITDIAVRQPEHTVVPYPNIPKSQYPKNIPLEVYTDEQTAV